MFCLGLSRSYPLVSPVAHQIQPVPRLMLTVVGALEEAIEEGRPGGIEASPLDVLEEDLPLGHRRREPGEVERGSTEERQRFGRSGAGDPGRFSAGGEQRVHGVLVVVPGGRDRVKGAVGPPLRINIDRGGLDGVGFRVRQAPLIPLRPRRARPHPRVQDRALILCEAPRGGHGKVRVAVADDLEQSASLEVVGPNRRPTGAPLLEGRCVSERQTALPSIPPVTGQAAALDDRPGRLEAVSSGARLGRTRRGEDEGNEGVEVDSWGALRVEDHQDTRTALRLPKQRLIVPGAASGRITGDRPGVPQKPL